MKLRFTFLFFFISLSIFSQGIDNLWLMGYESWAGRPFGGTNMNFITGVMDTSWQSRIMGFQETNGIISSKEGNLLFSSNGVFIANALNDTMQNGSGLNPSFFTTVYDSLGLLIPQANLIIPLPGDSNKYYLFHVTEDDFLNTYCSLYLYYSVIDMSQDNGRGVVIQKNVILLSDSLVPGDLTACKHANGRDWWLEAHEYNTNKYFKYLITPDGIQGPDTQDIGANMPAYFGECAFSPDGKYFAHYESVMCGLDIFDFDRCTGDYVLIAHEDINDSASGCGVAFSPNSQVLYVSSDRYVYQFNMASSNIISTQTTVAIYDGNYSPSYPAATTFYLAELAPDGRIYINSGNGVLAMHVINYPDSLGVGCDVCQHCISLPSYNEGTMANHPNYFLGAESGSVCDSLTGLTPTLSKGEGVFKMFPNPVVDGNEVTFSYGVSSEQSIINIYNIEGKVVAVYSLPRWSSIQHIKLPDLASGIYLARLLSGGYSANVKFIKQ